ncbi:MAG TPA: hypothetical protein VFE25_11810 [Opitutaceae bacterium]|jgi:hypothetical protein|nr:hypothetical protein [Opitutaceae bacterium]
MTTRCQALLAASALLAGGTALGASVPDWDETAYGPHEDMRSAASVLLRSDSARIATRHKAQEASYVAEAPSPGTVVMSAYVLREPKDKDVAMPRYETPAMRFLRDGTLYSHFGRKYSTQVLLKFYQSKAPPIGNLPPTSGIQLSVTLAW